MSHVTPFSSENGEVKEENPFSGVPEDRTAVDNILRINHGNQMRLGLMADAKANIMITVSSIVFSVTIANLDNDMMKWPLLTFACGCFFSLLFAIFAIIPKTDYPKTADGDIDRKSPFFNPLFFGHFAHLPIEEYKEDYAEKLMNDDTVYDALAGDIYGQGKVLALSKYKFLKWSYNSFLGGMSAAIVVFLLQGPLGVHILAGLTWIFDLFVGEIIFTLDGFRELLCQGSAVCRNGG
tara:strand:+ start:1963 stop:2673 length:711 start_codon:yes stop_codon:yes gene_type:complete